MTTAVILHYFEKSDTYKSNLSYFLKRGYRTDVDYYICISGVCSVSLPQVVNIYYHHIANSGYDFGGHAHIIKNALDISRYDHFIFLNSSVRGPFLPSYETRPWPCVFTDLIDDQTKLVGSTINMLGKESPYARVFERVHGAQDSFSHVQSMAYAMDRSALTFLIESGFYDRDIAPSDAMLAAMADIEAEAHSRRRSWLPPRHRKRAAPSRDSEPANKFAAILNYELSLSHAIVNRGWNISCLLPEYRAVDYRKPHGEINPSSNSGDPCFPGAYFGRSVHPYEVVFVKTDRGLVEPGYMRSLEASQLASAGPNASAYEAGAVDGA